MKKGIAFLLLIVLSFNSKGQTNLIREGIVINSTETGTWLGDNIPRSVPTLLTYKNNSITSVNSVGYLLCAGDETPSATNNNLDNAFISGNRFEWKGTNSETIITHGLFTGYNINTNVKFNYLSGVPYGIIFKSGTDAGESMTFTSGGCAYNICRNGKFGVRMKGINGVKIYNNTFYNDDENGWYFVYISANADRAKKSYSTGTKIFNNIFYSTSRFPMILVEPGCETGFECDYNVYWCTTGEPVFSIKGVTRTWAEWQSMGYDTHSVIIDPGFISKTELVPRNRLNYGKDLGQEWQSGLSTVTAWVPGVSPATTNQNGTWQVGARVYAPGTIPVNTIKINGGTSINIDKGTLQLTASVLPTYATAQSVIWSVVDGTGQATINQSGLVTGQKNGFVTVQATANDGSGIQSSIQITISNQTSLGSDDGKPKSEIPVSIAVSAHELKLRLNDLSYIASKASLYSLQGVLIAQKTLSSEGTTFNISKVPPGIYSVLLSKDANTKAIKILKP